MPNTCENKMILTFSSKKQTAKFKKDLKENKNNICNIVMPVNSDGTQIILANGEVKDLDPLDFYPMAAENLWGTKWGTIDVNLEDSGDKYLIYRYDTAWSPISNAVVVALAKAYNCHVDNIFHEPGVGFGGMRSANTLGQMSDDLLASNSLCPEDLSAESLVNILRKKGHPKSFYEDPQKVEELLERMKDYVTIYTSIYMPAYYSFVDRNQDILLDELVQKMSQKQLA